MKNEFILLMAAVCFSASIHAMELNHEQLNGAQAQPVGQRIARKKNRCWTAKEDELLKTLVAKHGTASWIVIANEMQDRKPRQCLDRWRYCLKRDVNYLQWTDEEDELLMQKYKEYGRHWAKIAKFFNRRTDRAIKRRFAIINRKSISKQPTSETQEYADTLDKQCTKNENCNVIDIDSPIKKAMNEWHEARDKSIAKLYSDQ